MIGETTFSATARYENGAATVKVVASTPYGRRSATVSQEIEDEKISGAMAKAFDAAIKSVREELLQTATKETARAIVAAANLEEVI